MRFDSLNAREFAARSVAARKAAEAERKAKLAALTASAGPTADDYFSSNVARACDETLELLRHAKKPSEKAQLSRALRDLREVWHLATGKPRPGLTRPEQYRPPRRELPRIMPSLASQPAPRFTANGEGSSTP